MIIMEEKQPNCGSNGGRRVRKKNGHFYSIMMWKMQYGSFRIIKVCKIGFIICRIYKGGRFSHSYISVLILLSGLVFGDRIVYTGQYSKLSEGISYLSISSISSSLKSGNSHLYSSFGDKNKGIRKAFVPAL